MNSDDKKSVEKFELGLLPDLWIPVIEVKISTAFFLSRSLWWRNKDGNFFREEWNEEIGKKIELTKVFQDEEIRKSAQTFLNLLRPEYQRIFGDSMAFVYCQKIWDILADYSRKDGDRQPEYYKPQLSTVFLFNPSKNTFDPLVETKPM